MSVEQLKHLKLALASVAGETWGGRPGGMQVTVDIQTRMGPTPLVVAETFSPDRARFIRTFNPIVVGELIKLAEQALTHDR